MSEHDHDIDMRDEYDFSDARRGPIVPPTAGKTRITIRLDTDILDWFRSQVHQAGGGNYQTLINHALRETMARAQSEALCGGGQHATIWLPGYGTLLGLHDPSSLKELVRQVVREEFADVIGRRANKGPEISEE